MPLITNGNLSLPSITTHSFIYYTDFTSDQSNALVWECSNLYVALQNENTAFGYPDPATLSISTTQFSIFQHLLTHIVHGKRIYKKGIVMVVLKL